MYILITTAMRPISKLLNDGRCHCLFLVFMVLFSSCSTLKESSKYQFNEGYYKVRLAEKNEKSLCFTGYRFYKVFPQIALLKTHIDTPKNDRLSSPLKNQKDLNLIRLSATLSIWTCGPSYLNIARLHKVFLPILMLRLTEAVYAGYRTDVYRLKYESTPLHVFKRKITHYGYSFGLFYRIGTARIDEET